MERLENLSARVASTWAVEITAAIISAGSLATLIIVLIVANDQPVLNWQWQGVTLNAMVSVLSTLSRLSALYVLSAAIGQTKWILFSRGPGSLLDFEAIDVASRGFAGCAQLLFRMKRIALVGALAVLVAVAFDPFAQQLVQVHSQVDFTSSQNATMPVSRRYDAGSLTMANAMSASGLMPITSRTDFSMQSAVLSGLTQQKDTLDSQTPLHCTSGNCTWSSVQSLAICSVCNDVSSALRRWKTDYAAATSLSSANSATMFGDATTYGLGDKVFLNNFDGAAFSPSFMSMAAYGTDNPERTNSLKYLDTMIWASGILRAMYSDVGNATWPDDATISATECGLYYCVKEYNISMSGNKVAESSTELTSMRRAPSSWQYFDGNLPNRMDGPLADLPPQDPSRGIDSGSGLARSPEKSDLMLGDAFNISQSAVLSLDDYMNRTFIRANMDAYNRSNQDNSGALGGFYLEGNPKAIQKDSEYEPGVMQAFHDTDDMDALFAALATSMSNAMRAHPSSNTSATGQLGQLVTTYRIVWPWIGLPVAVVIASIVQLLITLSSNKDSPLWKSSTLATLSRGHCTRELLEGATTIRGFRAAAVKQDVDLFGDDHDRWPTMTANDEGVKLRIVPKSSTTTTLAESDESHDSLLSGQDESATTKGSSVHRVSALTTLEASEWQRTRLVDGQWQPWTAVEAQDASGPVTSALMPNRLPSRNADRRQGT